MSTMIRSSTAPARVKKTLRSTSLALALTALAGCAAIETTVNRDAILALPEGGAVVMRVGSPLIVSLPPDPADGYGWALQGYDTNLLAIGGPDYMQDPKPPGMVGAAGTTTYRFRARAAGRSALEFVWRAPPGQPAAPPKTVRYDVTILPAGWFGVL